MPPVRWTAGRQANRPGRARDLLRGGHLTGVADFFPLCFLPVCRALTNVFVTARARWRVESALALTTAD